MLYTATNVGFGANFVPNLSQIWHRHSGRLTLYNLRVANNWDCAFRYFYHHSRCGYIKHVDYIGWLCLFYERILYTKACPAFSLKVFMYPRNCEVVGFPSSVVSQSSIVAISSVISYPYASRNAIRTSSPLPSHPTWFFICHYKFNKIYLAIEQITKIQFAPEP